MGEYSAAYYKAHDSSFLFCFNIWFNIAPVLLYLGLPCALLASLATITHGRHADPAQCASRIEDACGFVGNPDFYGLGIRLGVYMQWLASLIANATLPEDRRALASTYAIFSLSLAIALLILAFGEECTFDAEIIVILFIFFGGLFNVVAPLAGPNDIFGGAFFFILTNVRNARQKTPLPPAPPRDAVSDSPAPTNSNPYATSSGISAVMIFLVHPMVIFSSWFWVAMGSDHTDPFTPTPCGTSFFLFAHVKSEGIRSASRFMAFCSIWLATTPYLMIAYNQLNARGYPKLAMLPACLSLPFWTNFIGGLLFEVFGGCCAGQSSTGEENQGLEDGPHESQAPQSELLGAVEMDLRAQTNQNRNENQLGDPGQSSREMPPSNDSRYHEEHEVNNEKNRDEESNKEKTSTVNSEVILLVLIILIWSILGIELTLVWNSVSDIYTVNSTGQLIPLVGGLGAIMFVWYKVSDKDRRRIFAAKQHSKWGEEDPAASGSRSGSNVEERGEELRSRGPRDAAVDDGERGAGGVGSATDRVGVVHGEEAQTDGVDVDLEASVPVQDLSGRWHRFR